MSRFENEFARKVRIMSRKLLVGVLLAGMSLVWLSSGCGGESPAPVPDASKLLVIGIDSADWALWRPLLDQGRLPHLRAFMATALSGRMKTFYPLEKSPLLWASICTGVRPEVHGVHNFVKGRDQRPVTGSAWFAPAIWDIIGAAGKSTAVVGMWTTYPARPITGVMVSDYLPYGHDRERPMANLASPDSLSVSVAALIVDPASLGPDDLARFFDGADMVALERDYPEQIAELRAIYAADLGYLAVSRMLAKERDDDLFFFYLRGTDMVSHYFYEYLKPRSGRHGTDPQKVAVFGHVVQNYYDWADEAVGEVLGWFPPSRQVVIVSDHGFYGPRRAGGKGTAEHSEWGVFLVRSPWYVAGAKFGHLDLLDVAPTLLALLGLPPARDMPGEILAQGLTPTGRRRVAAMEKQRVPSYQGLRPANGPQGERDPVVDEEIRRQLRSLGYIN